MESELARPETLSFRQRRGWLIVFGIIEILMGCISLFMSIGLLLFPPLSNPSTHTAATVVTGLVVALYACMGAFFSL